MVAIGAVLGALAMVAGIGCFAAWRMQERASGAEPAESGIELSVEMRCEPWTPENTELGVFVSGSQADGSPCDMQLMFAGSGEQAACLDAGSYEAVPQLPLLMTADGAVFAASDAAALRYPVGRSGGDKVVVSYEEVDPLDLSEGELREAAAVSFIGDDVAERALGRALAERGEGGEHE